MNNLVEILQASSLSTTMSRLEIEEVVSEIQSDFDDYIESEKEALSDSYESDIKKKDREISRIQNNLIKYESQSLPDKTLDDTMTLEWLKNNWEWIIKLQKLNKSPEDIYNKYCAFSIPILDEVMNQILVDEIKKVGNHKRIILVGKAGSGKDYARTVLEGKGFTYGISYTTRPPRDNEENGKDYFFLSVEEFKTMIRNDEFYEYVTFNDWYYGTTNKQFYENDIFIMTPYGISNIDENDRKKSLIIYFDIDEQTRRERISKRNDADKVERRIIADEEDFKNFIDFDIKITNSNF